MTVAATSAATAQRDDHEERERNARGNCKDIDDLKAGESVRVSHASCDLSSVDVQQNDRRRGVVDAAVALRATARVSAADEIARYRYDRLFLVPPWPDIYENDADRRHSLDKALSDYDRVAAAWRDAGYDAIILPRDTVAARADFVLAAIA